MPRVTTTASQTSPVSDVNCDGNAMPAAKANRAPPIAATNAARPATRTLVMTTLIPSVWAAGRLVLTAPSARPVVDRRMLTTARRDDGEYDQAEVGQRPVAVGEPGAGQGHAVTQPGERVTGEHQVLHQQPEGEGDQRQVHVTQPDAQQPDDDTHRGGDESTADDRQRERPAMDCGELGGGQGAHTGERRLAQPDHPSLADNQCVGEEDDAEGDAADEQADPEPGQDKRQDGDRDDGR